MAYLRRTKITILLTATVHVLGDPKHCRFLPSQQHQNHLFPGNAPQSSTALWRLRGGDDFLDSDREDFGSREDGPARETRPRWSPARGTGVQPERGQRPTRRDQGDIWRARRRKMKGSARGEGPRMMHTGPDRWTIWREGADLRNTSARQSRGWQGRSGNSFWSRGLRGKQGQLQGQGRWQRSDQESWDRGNRVGVARDDFGWRREGSTGNEDERQKLREIAKGWGEQIRAAQAELAQRARCPATKKQVPPPWQAAVQHRNSKKAVAGGEAFGERKSELGIAMMAPGSSHKEVTGGWVEEERARKEALADARRWRETETLEDMMLEEEGRGDSVSVDDASLRAPETAAHHKDESDVVGLGTATGEAVDIAIEEAPAADEGNRDELAWTSMKTIGDEEPLTSALGDGMAVTAGDEEEKRARAAVADAKLMLKAGDVDAAEEVLMREVQAAPDGMHATLAYAEFLWRVRKDCSSAKELVDAVVTHHPRELRAVRAHAAFVAGTEANRDEARAVYVRAIAQHPESAQIHTDFALHLIRVWYGAVDLSGVDGTIVRDAEGLLRTAMQLDPALPAPAARQAAHLARLLHRTWSNVTEAERLFVRALRADPAHPGTLLGYAMLLTEIGQYQRAEVLLQRLWAQHEAEADDPIPPELLLTSAKLFAAAGNSSEAATLCEAVIDFVPHHRAALQFLAELPDTELPRARAAIMLALDAEAVSAGARAGAMAAAGALHWRRLRDAAQAEGVLRRALGELDVAGEEDRTALSARYEVVELLVEVLEARGPTGAGALDTLARSELHASDASKFSLRQALACRVRARWALALARRAGLAARPSGTEANTVGESGAETLVGGRARREALSQVDRVLEALATPNVADFATAIWVMCGEALEAAGLSDRALEVLRSACRVAPHHPGACAALARVLLRGTGNGPGASTDVAVLPDIAAVDARVAMRAGILIETALRCRPRDDELLAQYALALEAAGLLPEACRVLATAVAAAPASNVSRRLLHLARVLLSRKRPKDVARAEAFLRDAVALDPSAAALAEELRIAPPPARPRPDMPRVSTGRKGSRMDRSGPNDEEVRSESDSGTGGVAGKLSAEKGSGCDGRGGAAVEAGDDLGDSSAIPSNSGSGLLEYPSTGGTDYGM